MVFICSLDAEKAFDRINHYGMFSRLIDCKVPKVFIMLYHAWFTSLNFHVRWNYTLSYSVNVLSGLLQGNLLSPKLFIIFMDKLVRLVVDSKLGCKVYGHYFGIIWYADDILLIFSSIRKLQSMVDICTNFGFVNGMFFGPSKSHCLAIYPGKIHIPCSDIDLNGQKLEWIDKLKYLGVYITNNFKQLFDVNEQVVKFYSSIHSMVSCCKKEMVRLEILKRQ